jgi:hypothetical protein
MSLRRVIPLALTAGMAATLVAAGPAVASTAPIQLTLPAPTGPDQIGTVSLHLVQAGRPDPWVPGRTRELMTSLTYPGPGRRPLPDRALHGGGRVRAAVPVELPEELVEQVSLGLVVPVSSGTAGVEVPPGAGRGPRSEDSAQIEPTAVSRRFLICRCSTTVFLPLARVIGADPA